MSMATCEMCNRVFDAKADPESMEQSAYDFLCADCRQPGIRYHRLPDYMRASVQRYIEDGHPVGHFLSAIFSNDLKEAYARADEENTRRMKDWVMFMYNEMPGISQGSPENFKNWQSIGGQNGMAAERERKEKEATHEETD